MAHLWHNPLSICVGLERRGAPPSRCQNGMTGEGVVVSRWYSVVGFRTICNSSRFVSFCTVMASFCLPGARFIVLIHTSVGTRHGMRARFNGVSVSIRAHLRVEREVANLVVVESRGLALARV